MRLILALFAIQCYVQAQQDIKINYQTNQKSVQYVVIDLARQAGLGYNWDKSYAQTAPECRNWVRGAKMKDLPFQKAMERILTPVRLRYEVENGGIVLYRVKPKALSYNPSRPLAEVLETKIDYSSEQKSVQFIVIDLAKKVLLDYDWSKSTALADPERRVFVESVSIKNKSFSRAMAQILDPVGRGFRMEGQQIVLFRR